MTKNDQKGQNPGFDPPGPKMDYRNRGGRPMRARAKPNLHARMTVYLETPETEGVEGQKQCFSWFLASFYMILLKGFIIFI